jgi:hypothetical protein
MIKWNIYDTKYSIEHKGYLKKYVIFEISYNYGKSKTDINKDYILRSKLPGLKEILGYDNDIDKLKEFAESSLKYWLNNTGLEIIGDNECIK